MVKALNYGRMGNVCFQVATAISYALKHGLEFTVQDKTDNPFWNPLYFQSLVNPNFNPHLETIKIDEPHFNYKEIPFDESWRGKNIILNGYWQSESHFKEHRSEILYLFDFPYELKPLVSLHARYGDYLTVRNAHGVMKHIIVDEPYIKAAIDYVKGKTGLERIKVFSDNIPLFKERHGNLYDFEYSTNTNEIDDLVEISCCHSNINSSSTFSWWGAFLNRNPEKVIVTQRDWFTPNWDNLDTKDLIPDYFVKL